MLYATQRRTSTKECEFCGGINNEHHQIMTMEYVFPGEPHMAPIGTRDCPNA